MLIQLKVQVFDLLTSVSNSKIYKSVPREFFDINYKIKDEILNLKTMKLFNYSEEVYIYYLFQLSEKCGDIDFELNKIVTNATKLFNYINENLNFDEKIKDFLENIMKMKYFSFTIDKKKKL